MSLNLVFYIIELVLCMFRTWAFVYWEVSKFTHFLGLGLISENCKDCMHILFYFKEKYLFNLLELALEICSQIGLISRI